MENEYGYSEGYQQQEDQPADNQQIEQVDEAPSPTSLADAFAALRKGDENMDSQTQPDGNIGEQGSEEPDTKGSQDAYQPQSGQDNYESDDDDRGYSDGIEDIDVRSYAERLIRNIKSQAEQMAENEFAKKKYNKLVMKDIRVVDERGNVWYEDPENKGRKFQSRMEAAEWLKIFNQERDEDLAEATKKYEQEIAKHYQPTMNMLSFVGTYNKMSKIEQDIFDDIVEPNAVVDRSGNIIGFRGDLNKYMRQAKAIAARYNAVPQRQQQAAPQPQRPAMDMKTKGSSSGTVGDPEPKTIAEAMAAYQRQKNGGK